MVGIDEAGRGCAAGPLVIAGVKLKKKIPELNDSKKISKKKREELFPKIKENSYYHICSISAEMIDKFGLSKCIKMGLEEIKDAFKNEHIIFDGNSSYGVDNIETMIKADAKIPEVSAASILAKVTKDNELNELAKDYPNFSFEKHGAYLTKKHIEEIKLYGKTPIHRKSYKIKALEEPS